MKRRIKGKSYYLVGKKRRLPNGYVADLEFIEHPPVALMVPFLTQDKIIMLRQYRPTIQKYIYELPAGTSEPGESVSACARRELIEESGYAAKSLKRIGKIYPVPGYSTEIIFIYKAQGLRPQSGDQDAEEVIKVLSFSKSQIRRLFKSGKIVDAKTIAGLAFCGWL